MRDDTAGGVASRGADRGDGIGPEIAAAARFVDATGVPVEWEERLAGESAIDRHGHVAPRETIDAVAAAGSALKGPTSTPRAAVTGARTTTCATSSAEAAG
ncbi:MAG: isocitrate/isopropylmalate family dehydrogenase [Actinomycetota bacterium]|nr:isocitrate/isopropylmalate family dehydrogenase [Actinomycetota bacterium]